MQHITGIPRNQMCFSSLEDTISPDNPIRFIDAFAIFEQKKQRFFHRLTLTVSLAELKKTE